MCRQGILICRRGRAQLTSGPTTCTAAHYALCISYCIAYTALCTIYTRCTPLYTVYMIHTIHCTIVLCTLHNIRNMNHTLSSAKHCSYILNIHIFQTESSFEFRTGFSLETFSKLSRGNFSKLNQVWNSKLDLVWNSKLDLVWGS